MNVFLRPFVSDTRKIVIPNVCITGDRKTIFAIMPESREGSPYTEIIVGNVSFQTLPSIILKILLNEISSNTD